MSLWTWMRQRERAHRRPMPVYIGGIHGPSTKPDHVLARGGDKAALERIGHSTAEPSRVMTKALPDCPKLLVSGEYRLIDRQSHQIMAYGQRVVHMVTGYFGTIEWGCPPAHDGGEGTVHVRWVGAGHLSPVPPSQLGLKWSHGDDLP